MVADERDLCRQHAKLERLSHRDQRELRYVREDIEDVDNLLLESIAKTEESEERGDAEVLRAWLVCSFG